MLFFLQKAAPKVGIEFGPDSGVNLAPRGLPKPTKIHQTTPYIYFFSKRFFLLLGNGCVCGAPCPLNIYICLFSFKRIWLFVVVFCEGIFLGNGCVCGAACPLNIYIVLFSFKRIWLFVVVFCEGICLGNGCVCGVPRPLNIYIYIHIFVSF